MGATDQHLNAEAGAETRQSLTNHDEVEALADVGSELSFPASDPPSYMGGAAVAGPPPKGDQPREPASDHLVAPDRREEIGGRRFSEG